MTEFFVAPVTSLIRCILIPPPALLFRYVLILPYTHAWPKNHAERKENALLTKREHKIA